MNTTENNIDLPETDSSSIPSPKKKMKTIVIIICIVCAALVILFLLISFNPYNQFVKVEIGDSQSNVQKKVGGNYEKSVLIVGKHGKTAYYYEFEDEILVAKTHNYAGDGLRSTVNHENFRQANADMSLSELEEIFGNARLIRQNKDETCVYLWMENPSQYVVFNEQSKKLIASKMLNPVPNNTLPTLDIINNLGIPNSLEELENKIGPVTLFNQQSISETQYKYSCYALIENVEYDIFLVPGKYIFIMTSLPLNKVDSELVSKLNEQMTYSDVVSLFGSEGLMYSNQLENTGYSWGTDDPDENLEVTFGSLGYYEEHAIGSIERGLSLFSPTEIQWKFPAYKYTMTGYYP